MNVYIVSGNRDEARILTNKIAGAGFSPSTTLPVTSVFHVVVFVLSKTTIDKLISFLNYPVVIVHDIIYEGRVLGDINMHCTVDELRDAIIEVWQLANPNQPLP